METIEQGIVLCKRVGEHVALVTLNRPEKYNAVSSELTRVLYGIVKDVEESKDIWAAVLASSNNKIFCAGADLSELSAGKGNEIAHPKAGFAGFVDYDRKKPWIAAATGAALGGGCEISLACDMIVCGDSSTFGLPEVKRCVMAAAGGIYRLPRAVPRAVALEMIATGEPISAKRAYELGLVNRVTKDESVLEEALNLAEKICKNAPMAVWESLKVARVAKEKTEDELRSLVMQGMGRLMKTNDFKEGPKAFMEKRAPQWAGE